VSPRRLSLAAFLLSGALGCAAATPATPATREAEPLRRGPWVELTSPHFALRTDVAVEIARQQIATFEETYDAFADVAFPTDESRVRRLDVIVFATADEYHDVGAPGSDAEFVSNLPNDVEPTPTMLMFGALTPTARSTFQHELTHAFVHRSLARFPAWLNEGMAEFYATLKVESGFVTIGAPLAKYAFTPSLDPVYTKHDGRVMQLIPYQELPTVAELVPLSRQRFYARRLLQVRGRPVAEEPNRNYPAAWGLVHLMMTGPEAYRARFGRFIDGLTRGKRPQEAWQGAFGDVDRLQLQNEFLAHISAPTVPMLRTRVAPHAPPAVALRALSAAEVKLMAARLSPWTDAAAPRARERLDQALAADPTSPEVHFWRGIFFIHQKALDSAEAELAAALATHPDEPRYLVGLLELERARATWHDDKQRDLRLTDLAARLSRTASTAAQLDTTAVLYTILRQPDEGISFSERAMKADPTAWQCLRTHANLLSAKGRFEEAFLDQERALDLLPEGAPQAVVDALTLRLREYAARLPPHPAP
jgi:tetratricopeptide (TPR) repeat protein